MTTETLTLEDIARLRTLYESSTPKPWYSNGTCVRTKSEGRDVAVYQATHKEFHRAVGDARFVAEAGNAFWQLLELANEALTRRADQGDEADEPGGAG